MKYIFTLVQLMILAISPLYSQENLVINPSFEDTVDCPTSSDQVFKAVGWDSFRSSPDYFNVCSPSGSEVDVPNNWGGYQQPASGNGYCGFGTFVSCCPNIREFIGGTLTSSLVIGKKYYVSCKVALSISDDIEAYIATNNIGAMFSTNPYTWDNPTPITNNPPVYVDSVVTDTVNWTKIFGSFIADSAYQFIILGNFFDDALTDTITLFNSASSFAYYYIDDVCVSTDSLFAADYTYTGMKDIKQQTFSVYPNPSKDFVFIKKKYHGEPYDVKIYNSIGAEVYNYENVKEEEFSIDVINLNKGIFFIQITESKNQFNYKFLKL